MQLVAGIFYERSKMSQFSAGNCTVTDSSASSTLHRHANHNKKFCDEFTREMNLLRM